MVEVEGVSKRYRFGDEHIQALDNVSLTIDAGEFVAIMGPSGSGKSTLMNIIGTLDVPSDGVLRLAGRETTKLGGNALADLRNRTIGFVFQQFNLLPRTPALRQVMLPMAYGTSAPRRRAARARELLAMVGLENRMNHLPSQMSGGQQQRVAIARALANEPSLILADEPTGSLDTATGEDIMNLLTRLNKDGMTIVLVTHEPEIAEYASRVIRFRDGRLQSDERAPARVAGSVEAGPESAATSGGRPAGRVERAVA